MSENPTAERVLLGNCHVDDSVYCPLFLIQNSRLVLLPFWLNIRKSAWQSPVKSTKLFWCGLLNGTFWFVPFANIEFHGRYWLTY